MKKELFDTTKKINNFTKRCLMNESIYDYKGSIEIIKEYWSIAKNIKEFTSLVMNDERLSHNQGYWQLMKEELSEDELNNLVNNQLKDLADNHYVTYSDIGSISIGNDSFRYNIKNGYGDCSNNVYIIERDVHIECLNFDTTIKGDNINLYDYDCGNDVLCTLKGEYAIYTGVRVIALVKWK